MRIYQESIWKDTVFFCSFLPYQQYNSKPHLYILTLTQNIMKSSFLELNIIEGLQYLPHMWLILVWAPAPYGSLIITGSNCWSGHPEPHKINLKINQKQLPRTVLELHGANLKVPIECVYSMMNVLLNHLNKSISLQDFPKYLIC